MFMNRFWRERISIELRNFRGASSVQRSKVFSHLRQGAISADVPSRRENAFGSHTHNKLSNRIIRIELNYKNKTAEVHTEEAILLFPDLMSHEGKGNGKAAIQNRAALHFGEEFYFVYLQTLEAQFLCGTNLNMSTRLPIKLSWNS